MPGMENDWNFHFLETIGSRKDFAIGKTNIQDGKLRTFSIEGPHRGSNGAAVRGNTQAFLGDQIFQIKHHEQFVFDDQDHIVHDAITLRGNRRRRRKRPSCTSRDKLAPS